MDQEKQNGKCAEETIVKEIMGRKFSRIKDVRYQI